MRTHFCGLVNEALIGQTVTLCGWADVARNLGGVCFIDLRDHEGIVQVRGRAGQRRPSRSPRRCGYEDCLRITGTVRARHSVNDKLKTGQVEVRRRRRIEILNKAEPLPFHAHENPGEDIRLQVPLPRPAPPGDAEDACARASRWCRRCAATWTRAVSRTSKPRS